MQSTKPEIRAKCHHCGHETTVGSMLVVGGRYFCCSGCRTVYELLEENALCAYYELNEAPGVTQNKVLRADKYAFLENADIQKKLIQFSDDTVAHITLYLPQIHCSSCLWLLENLNRLLPAVRSSRVHFSAKEVFIVFDHTATSLRKVVETLDSIGYEPHLSLHDVSSKAARQIDRTRWYKIGVAGFGFSNIMMMSFAEYFAIHNRVDSSIEWVLRFIIVGLSIPVLFYSASEFFASAWYGIKNRYLNIDFPVALALAITFVRSLYELYTGIGSGYLDSMSGIVFFMLIGRWLQARTSQTITFDRDYKSFLPIALNLIKDGQVTPTEVSKIKPNDLVQIHAQEIVPVDAILSKGDAQIDYSFVTGESVPVKIQIGEMIYAGGKQLGGLLELIVVKEVSQSYLTNLWNHPIFAKKITPTQNTYDLIGKYFTYLVLALGAAASIYWLSHAQPTRAINALTTVLIVACPCALLLAHNYTNGNILRIMGLHGFYLRSADVLDALTHINHIVLDKTGTLTQNQGANVRYAGTLLTPAVKQMTASLLRQSSHPASQQVLHFLNEQHTHPVQHYKETEGKGIEGWINDQHIKIGSPEFVGTHTINNKGTQVALNIDGHTIGQFTISNKYRFGVAQLLQNLKKNYSLSLISGDNDAELDNLKNMLGADSDLLFQQTPEQKLNYIHQLQHQHHLNVMMIGDGLNDAGALKKSNLGIAIVDDTNNFTPASDAVLHASRLHTLHRFIQYAYIGKNIILITFCISIIYNAIGLYFAIQGNLSPVIAAILMPLSSITILLLTYGLSELAAYHLHLHTPLTKAPQNTQP